MSQVCRAHWLADKVIQEDKHKKSSQSCLETYILNIVNANTKQDKQARALHKLYALRQSKHHLQLIT